ncbi:MAG TPA: hypothetical protein VFI39_05795 [Gemmatimonadales bacterium]|nr:hypothetical protein [Gemmatimonadales bacterium]
MKPSLLLPFALASHLAAGALCAQVPGGAGIIYGAHHAFTIEAPPGWVIDNQAGISLGLHAVFYRTGESWQRGTAVMYVNTAPPDSGHEADPLRIFAQDSVRFVTETPTMRIVSRPSLQTHDHKVAYVWYFSGASNGRYEAVAYVAEKTTTPMIVLTSKTQTAFQRALPAFRQLVGSYSFLSSDVTLPR